MAFLVSRDSDDESLVPFKVELSECFRCKSHLYSSPLYSPLRLSHPDTFLSSSIDWNCDLSAQRIHL